MPHKILGTPVFTAYMEIWFAVICRQPSASFGQVACADHKAAHGVCHIHEHLRPLPGLGVFKDYVFVFKAVADILKMLHDGFAYIDDLQFRAQLLGKQYSVAFGSVRCAEAGHRHRPKIFAPQAHHIYCPGAGKHGERRVQSSGNADEGVFRVRVLHALFQTKALYGQYLLAALPAEVFVPGTKGVLGIWRVSPVCVIFESQLIVS